MKESQESSDRLWRVLRQQLEARGLDPEELGCSGDSSCQVKVVCVDASLRESLSALGETPRDQVLMVRVDAETLKTLDSWVETGATKSRSEAAALFIREGLGVRRDELRELEAALAQVEKAKRRLREKAQAVLGGGTPPADPHQDGEA